MRLEQSDLSYILARIEARQDQILAAIRALERPARPALHLQPLDVLKLMGAAAILWLIWTGALKPHDILPHIIK